MTVFGPVCVWTGCSAPVASSDSGHPTSGSWWPQASLVTLIRKSKMRVNQLVAAICLDMLCIASTHWWPRTPVKFLDRCALNLYVVDFVVLAKAVNVTVSRLAVIKQRLARLLHGLSFCAVLHDHAVKAEEQAPACSGPEGGFRTARLHIGALLKAIKATS